MTDVLIAVTAVGARIIVPGVRTKTRRVVNTMAPGVSVLEVQSF